jgi:lambda family phage portal protein
MKPNLMDRLIGAISPERGLRRVAARARMERVTAFAAGKPSLRTKQWHASNAGPNAELAPALALLRQRSRQMVRDNPYAARAVAVIAAHQVGYGITARWEDPRAQALWDQWAKRCDVSGMLTLGAVQWQVARARAESGEALVRLVRLTRQQMAARRLRVPLQLNVLEGDYLPEDTLALRDPRFAGRRITCGVELDATGARAAYWLRRNHPGEHPAWLRLDETIDRVPAGDVLHVYRALRPEQVRGIPDAASVLLRLKELDDYEDAALARAKTEAMLGVFFTGPDPMDTGSEGAGTQADPFSLDLYPGMATQLPPGLEPKFMQPGAAGPFEPLALHHLYAIAAGFGVTYDQLTGDLRQANYSSLRAGKIEFRRMVEQDQWEMLIPRLCDPIADAFAEAAMDIGALPDRPDGYVREWGPPRFEMVDPAKEIGAAIASVRAGFSTWPDEVASFGYDPRTQIQRIKEWNAQIDEAGVILDTDPRRTAGTGGAQNASQNAAVEIAATGAALPRQPAPAPADE